MTEVLGRFGFKAQAWSSLGDAAVDMVDHDGGQHDRKGEVQTGFQGLEQPQPLIRLVDFQVYRTDGAVHLPAGGQQDRRQQRQRDECKQYLLRCCCQVSQIIASLPVR